MNLRKAVQYTRWNEKLVARNRAAGIVDIDYVGQPESVRCLQLDQQLERLTNGETNGRGGITMGVDNPCFLQRKLNRIVFSVHRFSNLFDRNPDFGHPIHKVVRRCGDGTDNRDVRSVFDVSFVFILLRRG